MYKTPTLQDFQRSLDGIIHDAEHQAQSERGRLVAEYAAKGQARSGNLISAAIVRVDEIHKAAVEKVMNLVHEFVRHAAMSPAELGSTAKQRLGNLGVFLIGQVPVAGWDAHHVQQFQQQYTAIFSQRIDGAVRDIEAGIIAGQIMSVKDTDLQDIILSKFYVGRDKGWISLPVSSEATKEERIRIMNICDQLWQKGLIEWRAGQSDGVGRIIVKGVEYIERGISSQKNSTTPAPQRRKSEKFEILDSPKLIEADIAKAAGMLGVACLYMDLDGFKALNSQFSESTVDKDIIPPFQKFLMAVLGKLGFAYQEGGDEIVVVLPNATLGIATEFAESFRRMLSEQVFRVNRTNDVRLKISIGIAQACHGEDRIGLKEKANQALRQAKNAGRDRICIYSDDTIKSAAAG